MFINNCYTVYSEGNGKDFTNKKTKGYKHMKTITLKDGRKAIVGSDINNIYFQQIIECYIGKEFSDYLFSIFNNSEQEKRIQLLEDCIEDAEYSADCYHSALNSAQEEVEDLISKLESVQRVNKSTIIKSLQSISDNINSVL